MTQPINERYTNVAHPHDEDPEEHIGDPVPDPWDDEEVSGDGDVGSGSEPR